MTDRLDPLICARLETTMTDLSSGTTLNPLLVEPLSVLEDSNRLNSNPNDDYDDERLLLQLTIFRHESHSLRLSASNIAAIAGYHPWKELPMLLFDLIYQGKRGKMLLKQDTTNLSIELISEDAALEQLAAKAGVSVKEALEVKNGKRSLHSVEEANELKYTILKKARLTNASEMKELKEGVRSAIDTSFGTYNEGEALDQYEKIIGWPVTERNSEIMVWDFDSQGQPGKVYPLVSDRHTVMAIVDMANTNTCKQPAFSDTQNDANGPSLGTEAFVATIDQEKLRNAQHDVKRQRPFFSILGSIDGIREECIPNDKPIANEHDIDDDDSFCIRSVIVECKHRMAAIKKNPPLYDQIQAVLYMLMYQIDQADIVQVLRTKNSTNHDENKAGSAKQDIDTTQSSDSATGMPPNQQQLSTTIAVHRISLDDKIHHHRFHWEQTILPRILWFVQVVYNFRADDLQRYRLLTAIATKAHHDAWKILFEACPWLEKAETAFRLI